MLTFQSAPHHARHPAANYWSHLSEPRKSTFFLRGRSSIKWLFSNPPNPPRTLPVHDVIHIPWSYLQSGIFILTSLNDTPSPREAKAGRPAWTYIQQLCEDTGCSPEDMPEAMNDREKWRERVRDIRPSGTTWYIYIYIYKSSNKIKFIANPVIIYIYIYIYIYVCVCVCVCVCIIRSS